jgi:hypothetical protein
MRPPSPEYQFLWSRDEGSFQLACMSQRRANNVDGLKPVIDGMQWLPVIPLLPLGFVAIVQMNRATAGPIACFDVIQDITDHPRDFEGDPMAPRCSQNHTRLRLAAFATIPGAMGAIIKSVDFHMVWREQGLDPMIDRDKVLFLE